MGALPNYKEFVELIKKGSTVEAQEKIMEVRETAIDLKNVSLREKNRSIFMSVPSFPNPNQYHPID